MSNVFNFGQNLAVIVVATAGLFSLSGAEASTTSDRSVTAAICDTAAVKASRETGVPIDVLRAISLTETGRNGDAGFLP